MPTRLMDGVLSPVVSVQPARSNGEAVLLMSSIHSSAESAAVPPQATSLIATSKGAAWTAAARPW